MDRFFSLKPFYPDTISSNLKIDASIRIIDHTLRLQYQLSGDLKEIIIPEIKLNPIRVYDLWEHTCFELFIKQKDFPWYIEYNFSPSGDWNCFYISSYRVNEGEYEKVKEQTFKTAINSSCLDLDCTIDLNSLRPITSEAFFNKGIEIGISAVVESTQQKLNYYALVHKGEKPDFHNAFVDY